MVKCSWQNSILDQHERYYICKYCKIYTSICCIRKKIRFCASVTYFWIVKTILKTTIQILANLFLYKSYIYVYIYMNVKSICHVSHTVLSTWCINSLILSKTQWGSTMSLLFFLFFFLRGSTVMSIIIEKLSTLPEVTQVT